METLRRREDPNLGVATGETHAALEVCSAQTPRSDGGDILCPLIQLANSYILESLMREKEKLAFTGSQRDNYTASLCKTNVRLTLEYLSEHPYTPEVSVEGIFKILTSFELGFFDLDFSFILQPDQ